MLQTALRGLSLTLTLTVLIGGCQVVRHLHDYAAGQACYMQARQLAQLPEPRPASPSAPEASSADASAAPSEPDLAALRQENPDVIGWLMIPDTELSYPLVQGKDNNFYLSHQWDGSSGSCGAIFLDSDSAPDLSSWHSRIYGHRMNDTSMFGILHRYRNSDFWAEHPEFLIYTDGGMRRYRIFAAYEAPVAGPVFQAAPTSGKQRNAFLSYCLKRSLFPTNDGPAEENPVVTLATCTGHGHQKRWVVQGSLIIDR